MCVSIQIVWRFGWGGVTCLYLRVSMSYIHGSYCVDERIVRIQNGLAEIH